MSAPKEELKAIRDLYEASMGAALPPGTFAQAEAEVADIIAQSEGMVIPTVIIELVRTFSFLSWIRGYHVCMLKQQQKDQCSRCHGEKGGTPGNENRDYQPDGSYILLCDYCSAEDLMKKQNNL